MNLSVLHTRVFARRVRRNAVHQTIGMIHSTFAYGVELHQEGTTLTLELEYSVPIPILGKLAEDIAVTRNAREFELRGRRRAKGISLVRV